MRSEPSSLPDETFEALADPTRRAILELLRDRATVGAGEIARHFEHISRPAVSRHLRVLRESGLVRAEQSGREWHYAINPTALESVHAGWLATFAPLWDASLAQLKDKVERGTRRRAR
jgi:DNA-binding transcriptional ArsR family regulator